MNLLKQWGFTPDSWKGQRGEYWVLAQLALLVVFALVPVYPSAARELVPLTVQYGLRGVASAIALLALVLLGKGLIDLGPSLTPLPYPRDDGELVQTGVYGLVRHSLYSGLILGTFALSLGRLSLSHLAVNLALLAVLNAKASQEEVWLQARYPDYSDYRQRVKKLIPWVY
ncbi:isoprenylcysteine carboxylmethyltransferase family protein [Nodosilinea sp. LEGE 07088]|uniref:methyltransferase family protein n=1 Tax=Nodosilinea sp. LEGE 07088 TaxID=2777968 RepID=UPI0018820CBD|nr:isoprenylcysteine carboxylmethyltransferase family protein [Nodosilinea sp. LEGE 07088]MBE9140728.1 isoprenylcysteine carboxylmethyltransferase family protein [Nodosilinea sp. LEGE 07088]